MKDSYFEIGEQRERGNLQPGTYPEVTKILAGVVEGSPQVETYEVSNSSFHKIAAAVAV
jgi:hypothetical protein